MSKLEPYTVSAELLGHEGAVRALTATSSDAVITGSMDATVQMWTRRDSTFVNLMEKPILDHDHWITSLLYIPPPTTRIRSLVPPDGAFATGSMDKHVRLYNLRGELLHKFSGHEGGVTSLTLRSYQGLSQLLSGSWDGTARVWDLIVGECTQILPDHENGVCVCALEDGTIVTGSTGVQQGNKVVDFQLRYWQDGNVVKTVRDHDGPIRDLKLVPGIGYISCSNDGTIKLRDSDGNVLSSMAHPTNTEGKPGFVLGICVLPESGHIVSVSEDCSARVWDQQGTQIQCIDHPSGLWCVTPLPNGDFITGCDDKIARVFTCDASRASAEGEASFVEAVANAHQSGKGAVDLAGLPDYADRGQVRGKKDGDIQMFRNESKAWACQWSQPSQTWIDIGEVTGSQGDDQGGEIDGESYDIVIPVEIDQPDGSLRKLQIGFNKGQNPFVVAQAFIDKHMLGQHHLQEIADFISQRVEPTMIGPEDVAMSEPEHSYTHFPVASYNTFEGVKIAKLLPTLTELNGNVEEGCKLSDAELSRLQELVEIVQKTAYYHSSYFSTPQLQALVKVVDTWTAQTVYPAFDLLRLIMVHPQGPYQLQKMTNLGNILVRCLQLAKDDHETVPNATKMMALRVVANGFLSEEGRNAILQTKSEILNTLPSFVQETPKTVALSLATVLLNFARFQFESPQALALEERKQIATLSSGLLASRSVADLGEDAALRLLLALGTLAVADKKHGDGANVVDASTVLGLLDVPPSLQACHAELTSMLS